MNSSSSEFHNLIRCSGLYGITLHNRKKKTLQLTDLGLRLVAPVDESDLAHAAVEAITTPKLMRTFYETISSFFPKYTYAKNLLISLGVPPDMVKDSIRILKYNAEYSGAMRSTSDEMYLHDPDPYLSTSKLFDDEDDEDEVDEDEDVPHSLPDDTSSVSIAPKAQNSEFTAIPQVQPQNASHALRSGYQLDVYQLKKRLGEGFSSEVWKAEVKTVPPGVDLIQGQEVALKIYRSHLISHPEQIVRVEREFRTAQRIHHPNIVRIYEFMLASPRPHHCFLVMDVAKGLPLKKFKSSETFSITQRITVLYQIAEALSVLHSEGAIHRDVKPNNITVEHNSNQVHATLLDLGIVSVASERNVTIGTHFMGSKHWAPYEQLMGEPLSDRSDVYSLAAVAYFLFTEEEPFSTCTTEAAIATRMQKQSLKIPANRLQHPKLADILNLALSLNKDDRPSSAELSDVLKSYA